MFKRHSAGAIIFVLLALILTNPLVFHLWDSAEDKQDALLNTWIIAWVGHASVTDPLRLYDANIYYPYQTTLAFSESLVPQGLIALPFRLATDNPIFAYNVVLMAMLCLNGLGMYLLVFEWTKSRPAGWVAGAIYAFNPFNLGNLAQIQLISLGWLPLAMIYLSRILGGKPLRAPASLRLKNVVLFSLFFVLQSLSSIYFAVLAGCAVGIYLFGWAAVNIRGDKPSQTTFESIPLAASRPTREFSQRLVSFGISLILIGAVLAPFLFPYLSVQRELGFRRTVEDSEPFSASLHQFSEVSPQNLMYGRSLGPDPVKYLGGYPPDNLFPGLIALALGADALVASRRRVKWYFLAVLLFAFVLALGPRLYLDSDRPTDLVLPYSWLYGIFPPLQALRAPVRFDALVMFALAALAGLGTAEITRRWKRSALSVAIVALIAVEYISVPAAHTTEMPVASDVPAVFKWLGQQPPGVALQLPMIGPDAQDSPHADLSNQYFSTYHWHPTPDGFSGFFPPRLGEIADEVRRFPNKRAISMMQALDVQYLILRRDLAASANSVLTGDSEQNSLLVLLKDFGEEVVYRLGSPPSSPRQLEQHLYLPQPAKRGTAYLAYLILANPSDLPFAVKPTDKVELTASWSDGRVETVSTPLPLVTEQASVIPVLLTAPGYVGSYSLSLRATNGPVGNFELDGQVQVGNDLAGEVVLPLQVRLRNSFSPTYPPGATIPVTLDWLPLGRIQAYYSVSVRVVDAEGHKIAAVDREPKGRTIGWEPGSTIEDDFALRLPMDIPRGQFQVELLMYSGGGETTALLMDKDLKPQAGVTLGQFLVK